MENGSLDIINTLADLTTSGILLLLIYALWQRFVSESDRYDKRVESLHIHYGNIIEEMRKELNNAYAGHIKQVTEELRLEREQSKYERLQHRFDDTRPIPPKGMLKTDDS